MSSYGIGTVDESVKKILKENKLPFRNENIEKSSTVDKIEGKNETPIDLIFNLTRKCKPVKGAPGFFFYETQEGFNFISLDKIKESDPYRRNFSYTPGVISSEDPNRDFKILTYATNRNQDLIGKLERGAYSSVRYYINPVSFKPSISVFKSDDYLGKANNLGEKEIELPNIDENSDKTLGDLPSRIFVGMLDVGTLEKDASDEGWNDPVKRNADPQRIHSQSMMRYNQIFTQVIEITIPLNTNLSAGSIMRCEFPQLSNVKRKQPDPEISGLYMIKELAHYFDSKGSVSYTHLTLPTKRIV